MSKLSKITMVAAVAALALVTSCSKVVDLEQDVVPADGPKTCGMTFNGSVSGYDNHTIRTNGTKAGESAWAEGDKIYITFYNGETIVPGSAVYSEANGWSVTYDGDLATGNNQACEVRYFVNPKAASDYTVSISPYTEIYEATSGNYSFSGNQLTVNATLAPKSGRIRFTGTANEVVYLTGVTTYTTFAMATNSFSSTDLMVQLTVGTNKTTPYVYGHFTSSDCKIALLGTDLAYTRYCSSEIFKAGDSGYMAIPSEMSHTNWKKGLIVNVNGVDFKMLPVVNSNTGNYYLGETEVTEAQYAAVNGESSTSTYPVSSISYSNVTSWLGKLNSMTGLSFSLPSSYEWSFAAKGGKKTQNYTYSGSNTPGDVAWYADNCNSKQKVKTKAPNELGFYDMSGNVGEFVYRSSGDYYYYGGSYTSSASYITATSYSYHDYNSSSSENVGFRLCLECSPYL